MGDRNFKIKAGGIFLILFVLTAFLSASLMALSVKDDSYTTDELLYLPTGYSYLTEQTMRLGAEHPPLIREIAALPLLFLKLKPLASFWNQNIQGRDLHGALWNAGEKFLFEQPEASPEKILFSGRAVMVLITFFIGVFIFWALRREKDSFAGFIAGFLFLMSPLVLAHGRLVTMDVAAAGAALAAVYAFVLFVKSPSWKLATISGAVLGAALLVKFNLLSLLLFLPAAALLWIGLNTFNWREFLVWLKNFSFRFGWILLVAAFIITVVYQFSLANYPPSQQKADIASRLSGQVSPAVVKSIVSLAGVPLGRGLAQYATGVAWQLSRPTPLLYFKGEGHFDNKLSYYPVMYGVKEALAFHLIAIIALVVGIRRLMKFGFFKEKWTAKKQKLAENNLFAAAAVLWIIYYLAILIFYNRFHTGVRYLLPIYPFLTAVIGIVWSSWLKKGAKVWKLAGLSVLLVWQIWAVVKIYPSFLSYYNELAGGPDRGLYYSVDTDLEWGQDVKRLGAWVKRNGIQRIYVPFGFDYQIGSSNNLNKWRSFNRSFEYYLGERLAVLSPGVPQKGWIAVPARLLAWGTARSGKSGWSSNSYGWLKKYKPKAVIGHSIFVFYAD